MGRSGTASLVVAVAFLGITMSSSAKGPISHAAPISSLPGAAEAWVKAINQGNQQAACELQAVGTVGALPCAQLPARQVLHCPKRTLVQPRAPKEIRSLGEQLGPISEEGPTQAFVQLRAQKKGSKARGALGLELLGESWKVIYVRQGAETFVPAGAIWMTESWRKLWYPPTCTAPKNVK